MKKMLMVAAVAALPVTAQAQSLQYPGFYIGAEGGLNWLLNATSNATVTAFTPVGPFTTSGNVNINFNTGLGAAGAIGYEFVWPRVEVEGIYRQNTGNVSIPGLPGSNGLTASNVGVMANLFYDF